MISRSSFRTANNRPFGLAANDRLRPTTDFHIAISLPESGRPTPELSRAAQRRRLERLVGRLSGCFPRTLLGIDRREGEVVDALHTFDMAQSLNEAGRQEDDRKITHGVDHPCRGGTTYRRDALR